MIGIVASLAVLSACGQSIDSPPPKFAYAPFPNDSPPDLTSFQYDKLVPALQDYGKPYEVFSVEGKNYYSFGQSKDKESPYFKDLKTVTELAESCMKERLDEKPSKSTLVLDIDDTAISSYWGSMLDDFEWNGEKYTKRRDAASDPGIVPVRDLYAWAKNNGLIVHFITGRTKVDSLDNDTAAITVRNLVAAGFEGVTQANITFSPGAVPAGPFKTASREDLTKSGHTIVGNVGDQFSDINEPDGEPEKGVCAFKLPNPVYEIPFSITSGEFTERINTRPAPTPK